MSRPTKLEPMESFESNLEDARVLLLYSEVLRNSRKRAMRTELRSRLGEALRIPKKDQAGLDCLESDDLLVVLKPGSTTSRDHFADLRPLMRQALVAGCAAFETYLADKAMERIGPLLRSDCQPDRLGKIPLTIADWLDLEDSYERPVWGVRSIVDTHLREISSTASSQVGIVLSTVGVKNWAAQVDNIRSKKKNTTARELDDLTKHRNRIVHSADRVGSGRARIPDGEMERHIEVLSSVARAIEQLVDAES